MRETFISGCEDIGADAAAAEADAQWARARLDEKAGPVALVVKPGVLA